MNKNNVDWALKYLLPSEFGNTSLSEVYGCVFGEELSEECWYVQDNFYNEEEESVND